MFFEVQEIDFILEILFWVVQHVDDFSLVVVVREDVYSSLK